ncbi:unnamed protein product [Tuber aestivum]|uniref:Malic enzyme N-terminal domain-containing protein n=1 Tax=Tuber aestivum TaxID=59557 RepID=A0A292PPZ6_9PEZI|nr:unnamed protein product [Tuber aestivum]
MFRRPDDDFCGALGGGRGLMKFSVVSNREEVSGHQSGIGISIAKLVLMTLCGGVCILRTLPVVLDCGTDNPDLLGDEPYLGLRQLRVRGREYDSPFPLHTFVEAVRKLFPKATLHFGDFGLGNAGRLLEKHRPEMACINDDIQGTAIMTMAVITTAVWVVKVESLDLCTLVYGVGTAGTDMVCWEGLIDIADQFRDAVIEGGKSKEEAIKQIWLVEKQGLPLRSCSSTLTLAQKTYTATDPNFASVDMACPSDVLA